MKTLSTLIIAATIIGFVTTAHATADWCAVVQWSPDGFTNLREGPGTQYRVLGRLRPGDLIDVDTRRCFKDHCPSGWIHVTFAPRAHLADGWVSERFVKQVGCTEESAP